MKKARAAFSQIAIQNHATIRRDAKRFEHTTQMLSDNEVRTPVVAILNERHVAQPTCTRNVARCIRATVVRDVEYYDLRISETRCEPRRRNKQRFRLDTRCEAA